MYSTYTLYIVVTPTYLRISQVIRVTDMRGWQPSYVYRHETRAVAPRPRHDHRYGLVNDPDRLTTDLRPVYDLPSSHR